MRTKQTIGALLGALVFMSGATSAFAADVNALAVNGESVSSGEMVVYQITDTPVPSDPTNNQSNGGGPILKDVRAVEQGKQTLLIKTWDVPPGYDADRLVEADFEKGGLFYKKAYLLQISENYDSQTKLASETVTVSHEKKDDAVTRLQPIMDYSQDGFTGQLLLQADAISTEATGQSSYSYAVTDMREYTGLERNDPYSIPKTVEKSGSQLHLVDVNWTQMGEGSYKATASYSGSATGTSVAGYLSTATYVGEVAKEALDSVTYTVVYEGSVIPPPPFDFSPYLIVSAGVITALIVAAVLLSKRNNTKIYAMNGKEYQLVHKQKLTSLAPIVDLSPQDISGQSDEFMIVLDRLALRKLRGHSIKIIGKDGMMKEQRIFKIRHFHIGRGYEEEYQ